MEAAVEKKKLTAEAKKPLQRHGSGDSSDDDGERSGSGGSTGSASESDEEDAAPIEAAAVVPTQADIRSSSRGNRRGRRQPR